PSLSTWNGLSLPTYADIAGEVAVVRVTGNPGGPFEGDHRAAGTALATAFNGGGDTGIVTAIYDALKRQYGGPGDSYYSLAPILTGEASTFGIGSGEYGSSRPIDLIPTNLPTSDASKTVTAWGRKAETAIDTVTTNGLHPLMAQPVLDFMNDKAALDK